jgi:hypothetical protein
LPEELYDLYATNATQVTKSMRMRYMGVCTPYGRKENSIQVLMEKPEAEHFEDLDTGGRILQQIFKKWGGKARIALRNASQKFPDLLHEALTGHYAAVCH